MTHGTRPVVLALAVVVLLTAQAALAQNAPRSDDFRPVRTPRKGPAPPPVDFQVVARISLDSFLVDARLGVDGNGLVIAELESGLTAIEPREGGAVTSIDDPTALAGPFPTDDWVIGGRKGKLRFRIDEDGVLHAEKRSRPTSAWNSKWRLRFPGTDSSPPLAVGSRLYVGSSDNRVYAIKARNGHRLWVRDLGARAVRPMAAWSGSLAVRTEPGAKTVDVRFVLVVRGDGSAAEALDPHDGKTVGTFEPAGGDDRLQGGPVVLPNGDIALVRRGWRSGDVELLVLRIETRAPEASADEGKGPASVSPGRSSPDDTPSPGGLGPR